MSLSGRLSEAESKLARAQSRVRQLQEARADAEEGDVPSLTLPSRIAVRGTRHLPRGSPGASPLAARRVRSWEVLRPGPQGQRQTCVPPCDAPGMWQLAGCFLGSGMRKGTKVQRPCGDPDPPATPASYSSYLRAFALTVQAPWSSLPPTVMRPISPSGLCPLPPQRAPLPCWSPRLPPLAGLPGRWAQGLAQSQRRNVCGRKEGGREGEAGRGSQDPKPAPRDP